MGSWCGGSSKNPYAYPGYGYGYGAPTGVAPVAASPITPGGAVSVAMGPPAGSYGGFSGPIITPAGIATPLGPSVPVAYPQGKKGPPVVPLGPPTPRYTPGVVGTVNTGANPYGMNTTPSVIRY